MKTEVAMRGADSMEHLLPSPASNVGNPESVSFLPDPLPSPLVIGALPFAERLGVVADLTGALSLATRAGQDHLMSKVLALLRYEILEVTVSLSGSELARLRDGMSELEHEAGRIAPRPNNFSRYAQVVVDALRGAFATSAFPTL